MDNVSHKIGVDSAQVTDKGKGRDKTGDLVDCLAVYPGGQWRQRTLQQIAQDLCKPFGHRGELWARCLTQRGRQTPFRSFTLELSESVADVLSRAARSTEAF